MKTLLVTIVLVAALVVPVHRAEAAVLIEIAKPDLDLGEGWGALMTEGTSVVNRGDAFTFGTATISSGFVLAEDTCSGQPFAANATCWITVRPSDALPGKRTGAVTLFDSGGSPVATATLEVEQFVGVFALADSRVEPGGEGTDQLLFNHLNSTLQINEWPGSWGIAATIFSNDPQGGSVTFGPPAGAQIQPGTRYGTTATTGDPTVVADAGAYCGAPGGVFDTDEVEYDVDGDLTRLTASFNVPCGAGNGVTAGMVVLSSTPLSDGLWSPANARIGSFSGPTDGVSLFASNLSGVPLGPVSVDATGVGNHVVLVDHCAGKAVAPFEACAVRIGPSSNGMNADPSLDFSAGGSTTRTNFESEALTLSYLRTAGGHSGRTEPTLDVRSLYTHFGAIDLAPNGVISVSFDDRQAAQFGPPAGQSLAVGTYTGVTSAVDATAMFEGDQCSANGGSFTVEVIEFDGDELTAFVATFDMPECGVGYSGGVWFNRPMPGSFAHADVAQISMRPRIDSPAAQRVEITNVGQSASAVTLGVTGLDPYAFWFSNNECIGQLLPGSRCSFVINYTPMGRSSDIGATYLTIRLGHGNPAQSVEIFLDPPPEWNTDKPTPAKVTSGYWLLERDGTVHAFGDARHMGDATTSDDDVRLVATPTGRGYWVLDESGSVSAHGDAPVLGGFTASDRAKLEPGEKTVAMAPTATSLGYWIITSRGRVARFGDAPFIGDLLSFDLAANVIAATMSPSGRGVYMLGSDGGVFALGDATFAGSVPAVLPGVQLDEPTVGIVADPDGAGYWVVAADGGVFAFNAPYRGSVPAVLPGVSLDRPVNGMVPYGNGYLLVASDGGTFNFSNLAFDGSLGGSGVSSVVAVAPVVVGSTAYSS